MAFIQPCFIQLQHDFDVLWIINKLDALGYKRSIEQYGLKEGSESTYIICKCDGTYHYAYSISYYTNDWGINCINHIGLFLALASLKDDTDVNQWFVMDVEEYVNINQGDWFIATDRNKGKHIGTQIDPMYCHKATVEEIIEHFKKE